MTTPSDRSLTKISIEYPIDFLPKNFAYIAHSPATALFTTALKNLYCLRANNCHLTGVVVYEKSSGNLCGSEPCCDVCSDCRSGTSSTRTKSMLHASTRLLRISAGTGLLSCSGTDPSVLPYTSASPSVLSGTCSGTCLLCNASSVL